MRAAVVRRLRRGVAVAVALSLLDATALRAGVLCAQAMAPASSATDLAAQDEHAAQATHDEHAAHAEHPGHGTPPPFESLDPNAPPAHHESPAQCALMTACSVTAPPAAGAVNAERPVAQAPQPVASNNRQPASALRAPEPPPPRG